MTNLVPIGRALISVSDKTGLLDLARALAAQGVELISTGGTSGMLRAAGLPVRDVADVTGFPEMMDGRVKTLHPAVHGGLLALRDDDEHLLAMAAHGIEPIDLLIVNLYPFEATVARGADHATCIENIDIGGPAMIRAAAKNHRFVAVVTDPADYTTLLDQMKAHDGATTMTFRQTLALTAYSRTAAYDAAVSGWMARAINEPTPKHRAFAGTLAQPLRYGENPHQTAAFYTDGSARVGVATAHQWQGKELSYNNINDTDAAFELVAEFTGAPTCAIIKHANPCGVATGSTLAEAYARAYDCDRTSAFGGIVALNQPLDGDTAEAIVQIFTEVVIAPGADDDAKRIFAAKKNLRLLTTAGLPDPRSPGLTFRQVAGGFLVQDRDAGRITRADLKVVTKRSPTDAELRDLLFAWTVAKHVKSNAIIYAHNGATVGIGAGQMSRIDSTRIAARKSQDMADALHLPRALTHGSVVASDAFFPFADGLISAAKAGATAIIQPGGSMRILALTACITFALDQASKWAVVHGLNLIDRGEIDVIPPYLTFRMAWNTGINFGLLSGSTNIMRWALIAVAIAISAWVLVWVRREGGGRLAQISAGLLIGGAIGNVIDRLWYGAVADFLNMSCCGIENPYAFNVADIAIFAGAIGLVLFTGKPTPPKRRKTP